MLGQPERPSVQTLPVQPNELSVIPGFLDGRPERISKVALQPSLHMYVHVCIMTWHACAYTHTHIHTRIILSNN